MQRAVVIAVLVAGCAHQAPPPPPPPEPVVHVTPPPRAEPVDEMKVAGTLGSLSDDEIAGPFQRRWDDITHCYDDASAKLQYLGGKIELKLRVGPAGDPKSVWVVSSTFGNYDGERCVLAIARALHFGKPHGGAEAEFTYPIEFRARRPVQAWEEARVTPSLQRHKRDVHECRAKLPPGQPRGLPPQLAMTVYVAPGGKIASAGLSADAPLDDAFASCLVGKTRSWRLEDPLGKIAKATVGVVE